MNTHCGIVIAAACLLTAPVLAGDRPDVPAAKTWDLSFPADKEPDKLPVAGTIPNNWDRPDKVCSSYLTTKEQLAELWMALGQAGTAPDVDFAKQVIVVINIRASKVHITDREDKPVLSFAISPPKAKATDRTYTLATFPKEAVEAVLKAQKK